MQRIFFLAIVLTSFISFAKTAAADILIDKIHANEHSDIGLVPGEYDYHRVFGFRLAFDYLKHKGVQIAEHTEGRIDATKLAGKKVLFINLVSAERPPFFVSEIQAIVDFVRSGGSLFVITEHTNAYFHAWRLAPLMDEFDIQIPTDTSCERKPNAMGTGNGWILVDRFKEHPITKGLRRIHFQTGGCVDDRYAVAWTSDRSWADAWQTSPFGEKHGMGFFGNWKQDEGERSGPLGVVLAKNFGKGRIVITADQNMFSDICLDYADNWRLWINSFAWLLHSETDQRYADLADPVEYRNFRKPFILCAEDFSVGVFGTDAKIGCYHIRSWLGRKYSLLADDRYEERCDWLVIPSGQMKFNDTIVDMLVEHLKRNKNVLSLHTPASVLDESESVLMQTLRKLKVESPKVELIDDLVGLIKLENAGNIYLFLPELVVLNSILPAPEVVPNVWQQYRFDSFEQKLNLIFDRENKEPSEK